MQLSAAQPQAAIGRQRMDIVVIGHVDHGKSTLIGRLLADTGSLPQGKLEAVREQCRRNARPFEYAFLLDALKEEQSQGITIDSARCFFKSARRDYIIIDAPGHLEFLRNMISGAARAEAGLLLIDAKEGVQENSRRHGYMLGLLGIRQFVVLVNKMDLVDFDQAVFESVSREYSEFLARVGAPPPMFVPISAFAGDNVVTRSARMPWYEGASVLEAVDGFVKEPLPVDKPLRMPVQDVYKFTEHGDERRIIAGRVETGSVTVGDQVIFQPSGKTATVESIEAFNSPPPGRAQSGQSTGVTLSAQLYIRPGEVMCKLGQPAPQATTRFRVTLFWLQPQPMVKGRRYKLKLASARLPVWLTEVAGVLDASTLGRDERKQQVDRHDVAECVLETLKPVAVDLASEIAATGRFVIIDNYEIAGGGIVLSAEPAPQSLAERQVAVREEAWDRSAISPAARMSRYNQRGTLLLLTGPARTGKRALARALEDHLFTGGRLVYYLGLPNSLLDSDLDIRDGRDRDERLRRLGEASHLFTDAGLILITAASDLDDDDIRLIETLNRPSDLLVVYVGPSGQNRQLTRQPDLTLPADGTTVDGITAVRQLLQNRRFLPEYYL